MNEQRLSTSMASSVMMPLTIAAVDCVWFTCHTELLVSELMVRRTVTTVSPRNKSISTYEPLPAVPCFTKLVMSGDRPTVFGLPPHAKQIACVIDDLPVWGEE